VIGQIDAVLPEEPPPGAESYWPWARIAYGLLCIVIPAICAAVLKIRTDREAEREKHRAKEMAEMEAAASRRLAREERKSELLRQQAAKRAEAEVEAERARLALKQANDQKQWDFRFKQMEIDVQRQKEFLDGIAKERLEDKEHIKELMAVLGKRNEDVADRDRTIREQTQVIGILEHRISEMEKELRSLKEHLAILEQKENARSSGEHQ
jgi:hypothetical protein